MTPRDDPDFRPFEDAPTDPDPDRRESPGDWYETWKPITDLPTLIRDTEELIPL